jgi:hypothetical protein
LPSSNRTFRVFVSSTFSDLKEERNALQEKVFPKLRDFCSQFGCRFQAIDLRWGVREEAALDQQTMKICFEEIKRCQKVSPKPNFILLLGDRYGWRPLPFEIPADEFKEIQKNVLENEATLLTEWYLRDDNAVPPVYCLKPRTGDSVDYGKWTIIEKMLSTILLKATSSLPLPEDKCTKYIASATEQEIIQGLKTIDADEHVFGFLRTINGLPQTLEAKDFIDMDEEGVVIKDATIALNNLKTRLKKSLKSNIFEYNTMWTGKTVSDEHLTKLCEEVYSSLEKVIRKEINRIEKNDSEDTTEADAHCFFASEHTQSFVGRVDTLRKISDYSASSLSNPLVIYGVSGSGKSALLSKAAEKKYKTIGLQIVFRSIGATPSSTDIKTLLISLCREISRAYSSDDIAIPNEYGELVAEFPKKLGLATDKKPLLLFIDALDQLSELHHPFNLTWLPCELPKNVHIVVSTCPGNILDTLRTKVPAENIIELETITSEEGKELLDTWLKNKHRTLQPNQRKEVLRKFEDCRLPLYLKLAFEESVLWKSYTPPVSLGPNVPGIIHDLLLRLSADSNHGQILVSHSLSYIAAAKNGLTEDELLDVLSIDQTVLEDVTNHPFHKLAKNTLPIVVWSRLYFDMKPYFVERRSGGGDLLSFYHRQFGEVVKKEYLVGKAKSESHHSLALYFEKRGYAYPRTLSELAYQYYQYSLEVGDCKRIYQLADDDEFKRRQFQFFNSPEQIIIDVGYALDLAVHNRDTANVVHYSTARLNVTPVLAKLFLSNFIESVRKTPELVANSINLISDQSNRRLGFAVAALLLQRDGKPEFARQLVKEALHVSTLATLAQTTIMLDLTRELYCADIEEAKNLLTFIPNCPVRQAYESAWERGSARLKQLAVFLVASSKNAPLVTQEEIEELNEIKRFVDKTAMVYQSKREARKFDEQLAMEFGLLGYSNAMLVMATDEFSSGRIENAAVFISKTLYSQLMFPYPAIRTLSALVEVMGANGDRDLAEEHTQRIRTFLKGLKKLAKTIDEIESVADLQSELAISTDQAAKSWQPLGAAELVEQTTAAQQFREEIEEISVFNQLSNARQLLVMGSTKQVPKILVEIIKRIDGGEEKKQSKALLISVYAMSYACKNKLLLSDCAIRLAEIGLYPEALFNDEKTNPQTTAVLEMLASADNRCAASVAVCLRFGGYYERLFEFVRIANEAAASAETMDAILCQLVRSPIVPNEDLRGISDDIVGVTKSLVVPSGLGMYYFPGFMLFTACTGVAAVSAGATIFSADLTMGLTGAVIAAASLVGGILDLAVWRGIHLLKKPELSRRLISELGTSVCLVLAVVGLRLSNVQFSLWSLLAFAITAMIEVTVVAPFKNWLFTPLTARFIKSVTVASVLLAITLGAIFAIFLSNLLSTDFVGGIYLGGILFLSAALNVPPKMVVVRRHYGSRGSPNEAGLRLDKDNQLVV